MDIYTQAGRPLTIQTPLGPDVLLLTGIRGHEAVSELYRFELDLVSPQYMVVEFDKLIGQPVSVELQLPAGTTRYFHGIVSSLTQSDEDQDFNHFQATVVPRFWLWTKRFQSRIFQQQTVPEILQSVLADLAEDVQLHLVSTYESRDYTVQYQETDFAFASRLMEEEGISYYFEHQADKHILHLVDDDTGFPETQLPSVATYDPNPSSVENTYRITRWRKTQHLASGKFAYRDYRFELPDAHLEVEAEMPPETTMGTVTHKLDAGGADGCEVYDYPGFYAKTVDKVSPSGADQTADLQRVFDAGQRAVDLRAQAEAAHSIEARGESNCGNFMPGYTFTLLGQGPSDGKYLLKRVDHQANVPDFRSGEESPLEYANQFCCLPAELTLRPRRVTPRPMVHGTQTATVVGPAGSVVFTDKYGRVKVQFHWDRQGQNNADSSCWVRVAQFWAGKRWGAFFWPRIGHEVVIAFKEGDPDQPMIVGSLYNDKNMPPFELPDNADIAGIKSCTIGGQALEESNQLFFHDQPSNEHLQVHSQTHEVSSSKTSRHRYTPGPSIELSGTPNLPVVGSGSGGGMLEFADVACLGAHGHGFGEWWHHAFPGSVKTVYGNNVGATIMGDHVTHTLGGAEIKLVFDPLGMLEHKLFHSFPNVGAALFGVNGNVTMTLGSVAGLTYFGDDLSVKRIPTKYELFNSFADKKTAATAVKAMLALTVVTALASDIAARVIPLMSDTVKAQAAEEKKKALAGEDTETPLAIAWAQLLSRMISQRCMGVVVALEQANADVKQAQNATAQSAASTTAATNQTATQTAAELASAKTNSEKAVQDAATATTKAADAVTKAEGAAASAATATADAGSAKTTAGEAKTTAGEAKTTAGRAEKTAAKVQEELAKLTQEKRYIDGNHELGANSIKFCGKAQEDGGDATFLWLNDKFEAYLLGRAKVDVQGDKVELLGKNALQALSPKELLLRTGPELTYGAQVKLSNDAKQIELATGTEKPAITLDATANSIKLSITDGLSILMDGEGKKIVLKVADNTFTVSAQEIESKGLKVISNAQTQLSQDVAQLKQSVKAIADVQASLRKD